MNAGDRPVDDEITAGGTDARSDAELLRLFLEQRDQVAMTAIVRRHGPLVMGLSRSMLKNEPHRLSNPGYWHRREERVAG
jgi:hypothetical protein